MGISYKKNVLNGTLIDFSLQDFRSEILQKYRYFPCPLCGTTHPLRIHSYPKRYYRDPLTGENVRIRIITIICMTAKNDSKPYTKRLLPDFLLPGRVIRSDKVMEALKSNENSRSMERVCEILGCIDFRTGGKALLCGLQAINKACLYMEERLASFSVRHTRMPVRPDTPLLTIFSSLVESFNSLQVLLCGGAGYVMQHRDHALLGAHWPTKKPTTYVCGSGVSADTS